ncbi:hypothetical protein [Ligilactobacillus acidipiscis]|uniref:hypothetical protein n=1 Tax=Ligilactobacillus acidipiscis TaxID=89059 RepID=UPI0023F8C2B1|nr:hypothetical protein [Ligilactobacillus acidipiscis]WEV58181.1 hypothetical protein OZX66_12215 [Ligilactobacillus acidipiscis]
MTKEKRENLIIFLGWLLFITTILISKQFLWPSLLFVALLLALNWLLNKYKPLKKGPELAWWKQLLFYLFIYVVTAMVTNFIDKQPIFSNQTLVYTIIFAISFCLGAWSRKREK